jgi:hypothetical protein
MLMPEPHSHLHDSYVQSYRQTGVKKVLGVGRQLCAPVIQIRKATTTHRRQTQMTTTTEGRSDK